MAKPWARYEIGFIDHDKFRAINANAICLWQEGKNYCDSRLTDGLIPEASAKHFRFYSRKAVVMLTTSCGLKPGTSESYAPLWEMVEAFGFKMHDYLDHNDCRETVLERLAKGEDEKKRKNENLKAWRERRAAETAVKPDLKPAVKPENRVSESVSETAQTALKPDNQKHLQKQNTDPDPERTLSPSARVITDEDLGDRARELLQHYAAWYEELRGSKLRLIRNALEFQEACDLCALWADDRLEKLAKIVLTTDDGWISGTDRGFKIFARKATWADARLATWERQQVGV